MGFFDFINTNGSNNEEKVVNAEKERMGIRKTIKNDLRRKLKFSDSEIKEVIQIIDNAEREINDLKFTLTNVNIDNDNTETDVELASKKIREAGERMALGIKQKTAEILLRRQQK